jgi:hypothetical protein
MNVLLSALHFGYYRNYESVITALAARGHHVHLTAAEPDALGGHHLVERLAAEYPTVTFGFAPPLDAQPWFRLARKLRMGADYVRFHDEPYTAFRKAKLNLTPQVPRIVRRVAESRLARARRTRRALGALLRAAEALMPVSGETMRFLASHDPDIVLLVSVSVWRAPQMDHLRAARALGCRTAISVFSWDHLSSKALMRMAPDRMFV